MGAHTVAIDNAAHHDHTHHPMVTKMIHVTEDMLEQLVEGIDDKTTLLVFGDHGFTQDGNHGGETRLELASAVFAYQKTPFPMYESYMRNRDLYE